MNWSDDNENLLVLRYTVVDLETGAKFCKGVTRQAAIDRDSNELLFLLPEKFLERLRKAVQ